MSTSDPSRFLKMAFGIAAVVLVVGGGLYLGSGADPTAGKPSIPPQPSVLPQPASAPEFDVTPHQAKLGEAGVEEFASTPDDSEDGKVTRTVIGPSDMLLQMATEPTVKPASSRAAVESFVAALLPQVERCWSASAGTHRTTWNLVLRVSDAGLDTSDTRLRGLRSYDLESCLGAALAGADATGLQPGLMAHWPVVLDPSEGVQMD
jgi:hypothetical protein